METHKPKTLDDFPKFVVSALRRGATSEAGYTTFEFDGRFDRVVENIPTHWFWLLFGKQDCVCASPKSLDKATWAATLSCDTKGEPKIVGHALAYLSPYWQAYHVWMVLDPNWGWEKKQFHGCDAIVEDYEAKDVSIVAGREVRVWTKVVPVGGDGGQSRHYPAADQTLPAKSGPRMEPSGWGHEHCELCNTHIDAGDFGYCDPGERWMCERCYQRYVTTHDLSFVDEI